MKKSMWKKLTAMLAVTALGVSLLGGCGSGESGGASEESSEPPVSSEESSEASASGSGETPEEDDHSSWLCDEPTEISIMIMDGSASTQQLKNDAPAHEEIFKKTNVKINLEIIAADAYDEKLNASLATGNFPDLVYLRNYQQISGFADDGIYEPLSQYINAETMPNFYKMWEEHPNMKMYSYEGEMYVFPAVAREEMANGFGPCIRMDLLEKNNLEVPKTWDELLDVLAKLKEIYPDIVPWSIRKGTPQLLQTTAYMLGCGHGGLSRGTGIYWDEDEGKYIYGPADVRFKEVLSFLNKAYEMGVLDPEYINADGNNMADNMQSGKSVFFCDNSGFAANYTNALRTKEEGAVEDAVVQLIPIPENSFGQRRALEYDTEFTKLYAVNAKAKNKDLIIKFIDWMYSQEGSDISNYGVEGLSFQYNENGEPEFIPEYIMQFKDATPSDYYAVYSDLGITKLDWCLWACNMKTSMEIQKITGSWTDLTDEYWSIIEADDAYVAPHLQPPLTAEESERVTDITTDLDTFFNAEFDNYIMGRQDIATCDDLIAEAEERGVRELEEIWNTANDRAMNSGE